MEHWDITIKGDVQGVFYRASAQKRAEWLDLTGIASNRDDGTVMIEAEGPPDKLEDFLAWCKEGSEAANVKDIEVEKREELKGFKNFEIM